MTVLRSYVSGAWTGPADDGRPVLDAVTGEEVARVSSAGIDLEAALGRRATVNSLPPVRGDMPQTYADVSKARRLLGYNPKTRFGEGVRKFVEWYLEPATT